jgi:RNA polymerase sigma factor (sigma-70 family)
MFFSELARNFLNLHTSYSRIGNQMTVPEYNHSVEEYADRLYRFVLKNIKDEDTAQDIIQDTFEKLWVRHETVTYSKVRSYLFTSAYHTLIDYTRKSKKLIDIESMNTSLSEPANGFFDLKKNLDQALEKIPELHRAVILLRDYEGYSYEEIGLITGLTESQVKVYIYRGRMALRKLIGNPEVLL